jgi:hypothetical protein
MLVHGPARFVRTWVYLFNVGFKNGPFEWLAVGKPRK